VIWFGFYIAYQAARGAADRSTVKAFVNGQWVLEKEQALGALFEPSVQRVVDASSVLATLTSYTYWLSQFAVVGLTLLWVYFRRHERFAGFRNWLIAANLVGLVGYVLMPTAPPRMFPEWGFVDTLDQYSSLNHDSGIVAFAANPYAAMPSLHSMDALIVGIVMAGLVRSRLAKALWVMWPMWVAFTVVSTGNHYWLDVVAGFAIALLVGFLLRQARAFRQARAVRQDRVTRLRRA
jgi:membrane-associated phospholipid phosphatase